MKIEIDWTDLVDIEVDGGVDLSNAAALSKAGATILVAGAAVYGASDPGAALQAIARAANAR